MTSTNQKPTEYISPEVIEYDFLENTLGAETIYFESQNGYSS